VGPDPTAGAGSWDPGSRLGLGESEMRNPGIQGQGIWGWEGGGRGRLGRGRRRREVGDVWGGGGGSLHGHVLFVRQAGASPERRLV